MKLSTSLQVSSTWTAAWGRLMYRLWLPSWRVLPAALCTVKVMTVYLDKTGVLRWHYRSSTPPTTQPVDFKSARSVSFDLYDILSLRCSLYACLHNKWLHGSLFFTVFFPPPSRSSCSCSYSSSAPPQWHDKWTNLTLLCFMQKEMQVHNQKRWW